VRIAFEPRWATYVEEHTWHESQRLGRRPDGGVELVMEVGGTAELRQWILRPLVELARIQDRLDAVEEMAFRLRERGRLRERLGEVQDLERIIHQIDRLSNIVRSLLDTVRLGKLEVQRVGVETLINQLLPLLEHVVRKRGISMTTSIPKDLLDVAGDPSRLQQVFINLMMNAVEATPADGMISVTAAPSLNDGRGGVSIQVTDTGTGISQDALGQIFEPFYTTKPLGEGTGLGLAITRDIVREHGGLVVAQSRPGQGSTFSVWLPAWEGLA